MTAPGYTAGGPTVGAGVAAALDDLPLVLASASSISSAVMPLDSRKETFFVSGEDSTLGSVKKDVADCIRSSRIEWCWSARSKTGYSAIYV